LNSLPSYVDRAINRKSTVARKLLIIQEPSAVPAIVRQHTLLCCGVAVDLSEEFRKRALECFRWAQSALTVRARTEWLNMAQFWHQLAQTAERDKVGPPQDPSRGGIAGPTPQA
jgi:hypothetical protein